MKTRISYDHQIRLPIVALVIKATPAFITGKIETEARFLAMKPKVCLRPSYYPQGSLLEKSFPH